MFFDTLKKKELTKGHFLGFIHVLIGRRISRADGTLVSRGMAWRDVAGWLKKLRWDPEAVRELGQDPDALPPRDRQRFWFTAIAQAGIDSPAAIQARRTVSPPMSYATMRLRGRVASLHGKSR